MRGGAFLKGKEGRVGFRKNYFFAKEEPEQFESAYVPITPKIKFIFIVPHLPRTQEEEYNTYPQA